jgi:hypothetical protein
VVSCQKQQHEVHGGEDKVRCIHQEADTFLQIVEPGQCAGCPLVMLKKEKVDCSNKQKWEPPKEKVAMHEAEGYPPCPYRYQSGEDTRCSITSLKVDPEICHRCDEGVREHVAGTREKIKNYYGAVRRWYADGKPTRTEEQVEHLFEENCKDCDRYDPDKHACKNCGCTVSTKSSPLANKLAMATEHCPLGRF